MNFVLDYFELLFRDLHLARVHEKFLIATAYTRVEAAQEFKLLFFYFYARFLFNFSSCHSYKISTFIQHPGRSLEHQLLQGDSELFNE